MKVIHDYQFDPKALDLEISHHQFNLFQWFEQVYAGFMVSDHMQNQ